MGAWGGRGEELGGAVTECLFLLFHSSFKLPLKHMTSNAQTHRAGISQKSPRRCAPEFWGSLRRCWFDCVSETAN